jgi:UDP-N-acetyl-D-mannosaminuronic acid dehydrogenase
MRNEFETVSVHGLGYIGLPTAVLIASRGIRVVGVDISEHVTSSIMAGKVDIPEPDLDGLLQKVVSNGMLTAQLEPAPADVFLIAVPTPVTERLEPNVDLVDSAARRIATVLRPGNLVIVESTCPIGTTERVCDVIREQRPDLTVPTEIGQSADISVAYCPERVLPGRILAELVTNDRCIGGITDRCTRRAQRFYKSFVRGACIATTARIAEMVKLAENAYRDTNIAFANELSLIADRFDIDVWDVIDLANRHPRVNILRPGPGVGGHCIAVDPWFLVHSAPEIAQLIRTSRQVNDKKLNITLERCSALLDEQPYATVACLGLAFKANVDDLRESPALHICAELARRYGDRIIVVEPHIKELPAEFKGTEAKLMPLEAALPRCEIAIVLVEHDQFKTVPVFDRRHMTILDTRGIWRDVKPMHVHVAIELPKRGKTPGLVEASL